MKRDEEIDRVCRRVYVGVRDGVPDPTDVFDLAAAVLAEQPGDRDATELASSILDGTTADQPRMRELAGRLLERAPSEEPRRMARLDDALRLVNQDLAASGFPRGCRLLFLDSDPAFAFNRYVASWDGTFGTSSGVSSADGDDPVSALVAVADDAQDAVMHTIWSPWPVCPAHRSGTHARALDGAAVWWCAGDGGHGVAAIGGYPAR